MSQDEAAAGVGGQWPGRAPLPRHPRRRHPPRLLGLRLWPAAAAGGGAAAQPRLGPGLEGDVGTPALGRAAAQEILWGVWSLHS